MIAGMEIVFERMKQYPEEFVESNKWRDVIAKVIHVLDEKEIAHLHAAAHQAHRDWFMGAVMRVLAGDSKVSSQYNTVSVTEDYYGSSLYEMLEKYQAHRQEQQEHAAKRAST